MSQQEAEIAPEIVDLIKELQRRIEVEFYSVRTVIEGSSIRASRGGEHYFTVGITNDGGISLVFRKSTTYHKPGRFLAIEERAMDGEWIPLCDPKAIEKMLSAIGARIMKNF
jgi:hypothetical protein